MLYIPPIPQTNATTTQYVIEYAPIATSTDAVVPFYSQFADISSTSWQKIGCGITSLAMVIDYYVPDAVSVNGLLKQGIAAHAYQASAGWSHAALIKLSNQYGLSGKGYYLGSESKSAALTALTQAVAEGPVIASIHYKFEPTNPIPHMVVITQIENGMVHYNDPAAKGGDKKIAIAAFQKAWKQKYIVIRPT